MDYLIALIFVSFPDPAPPKYSFGHCYQASDSKYRPNVIGVRQNNGRYYTYRIWYGYDAGWSTDLTGKILTIETVYSKEIKCP